MIENPNWAVLLHSTVHNGREKVSHFFFVKRKLWYSHCDHKIFSDISMVFLKACSIWKCCWIWVRALGLNR